MPSEKQAAAIKKTGEIVQISSFIIMAIYLVISSSIHHLWCMLNGFQLSTHMLLYNMKFPSNTTFFLSYLVPVATFNPLPVEAVWSVLEYPPTDSYNALFDRTGYRFIYSVENMSTAFIAIQVYILVTILCFLILWTDCKKINRHNKFKKLTNQLFFGSSLRFIYEGFLQFSICIIISLTDFEWNSDLGFSVLYSNVFTIGMAVALVGLPIYICFYYHYNMMILDDTDFKLRYGSLYDGMDLKYDPEFQKNTRKVSIWFPLSFILRRIAFMAAAFCLSKWPVFQLMTLFYVTTAMIIYLMWFSPFADPFYTKVEVMNETTTIFLLYSMLCFTDWITSPEDRFNYGWFYIVVTSANSAFHLYFLCKGSLHKIYWIWLKHKIKRNHEISKAEQEGVFDQQVGQKRTETKITRRLQSI